MNILDIKNGTYSISQAYFLGAHVKYCRDGETRTLYVDTFLNSMRRFLDDPRSVTSGWSGVEKVEPEGVEGWRRILNEEDVSFFFDKLSEIHRDRKEFWLRYIKSAQRVFLLIDTPKKRELKTIYSKDEKLSAAVSRLFTFRSDRKSEQYLLIMTFRDHIFVEGSNTGFGCQLYDRNLFEKKFKSSFYENQSENVIKDSDFSAFRGIASGRIKRLANHDSGGRWVRSFESELAALGVFPDVGGSSAHQGQFKKGGFSGKINLPKEDDLARELASASTDNFESILNRHGFATVNKTATKGRLWVYHHPRLPDLKVALESYGITLVESPSGSMSTGHKRAWYFAEG